jgi:hypothetical protein
LFFLSTPFTESIIIFYNSTSLTILEIPIPGKVFPFKIFTKESVYSLD